MSSPRKEWEDLGFNPKKDGYWASMEQIKLRMKEKELQQRKARLVVFGITVGGIIFLSTIAWMFING